MQLPPGAGPLRKINGPTAGLAPATPSSILRSASLVGDPFGTFADPNAPTDDGSDGSGIPTGVYGNDPSQSAQSPMGVMGAAAPSYTGTALARSIPVTSVKVAPRGYHLNKHGYWSRLWSGSNWIGSFHGPGTMYVRNRRRNPLNPRALHRSISRLISAKHAVHKLGILEVPRRHKRSRRPPPFRRRRSA
jgi:hypothetical protein